MRRQTVVGHARSLQGFLPPRILAAETACSFTYRNPQRCQNSRLHRSVQRYQDAQRHWNMQRYQEAQCYRNMSAIGIRTCSAIGTRNAIRARNAAGIRNAISSRAKETAPVYYRGRCRGTILQDYRICLCRRSSTIAARVAESLSTSCRIPLDYPIHAPSDANRYHVPSILCQPVAMRPEPLK